MHLHGGIKVNFQSFFTVFFATCRMFLKEYCRGHVVIIVVCTPKKACNFCDTGFPKVPGILTPDFKMTSAKVQNCFPTYIKVCLGTFFKDLEVHKEKVFFDRMSTEFSFFFFSFKARLFCGYKKSFNASKNIHSMHQINQKID